MNTKKYIWLQGIGYLLLFLFVQNRCFAVNYFKHKYCLSRQYVMAHIAKGSCKKVPCKSFKKMLKMHFYLPLRQGRCADLRYPKRERGYYNRLKPKIDRKINGYKLFFPTMSLGSGFIAVYEAHKHSSVVNIDDTNYELYLQAMVPIKPTFIRASIGYFAVGAVVGITIILIASPTDNTVFKKTSARYAQSLYMLFPYLGNRDE